MNPGDFSNQLNSLLKQKFVGEIEPYVEDGVLKFKITPTGYLPLTGGDLSNNLWVDKGVDESGYVGVKRGPYAGNAYIGVRSTADAMLIHDIGGVIDGALRLGAGGFLYSPNGTNYYTIYHQNNSYAMVQAGANANGRYVRFSDGTQICWYSGTVTDLAITSAYGSLYSGSWLWYFPADFIDTAYTISGTIRWGTGASWISAPITLFTNRAAISVLDVNSRASGTSSTIKLMAVGRWQ
jgi:hypothetical protein